MFLSDFEENNKQPTGQENFNYSVSPDEFQRFIQLMKKYSNYAKLAAKAYISMADGFITMLEQMSDDEKRKTGFYISVDKNKKSR